MEIGIAPEVDAKENKYSRPKIQDFQNTPSKPFTLVNERRFSGMREEESLFPVEMRGL